MTKRFPKEFSECNNRDSNINFHLLGELKKIKRAFPLCWRVINSQNIKKNICINTYHKLSPLKILAPHTLEFRARNIFFKRAKDTYKIFYSSFLDFMQPKAKIGSFKNYSITKLNVKLIPDIFRKGNLKISGYFGHRCP